jgi:hypothetical protein
MPLTDRLSHVSAFLETEGFAVQEGAEPVKSISLPIY